MEPSWQTDAAWSTRHIGAVRRYQLEGSRLSLHLDGAQLFVAALAPDLVRVRLVPDEAEKKVVLPSFAVVKDEWDPVPVELYEEFDKLTLRIGTGKAGASLIVEVWRSPLRLRIVRADGSLVAACAADGGFAWDEETVHWRMQAPPGWRYYGFGQKQGFLDKRGQRLALWTTDETLHVPVNDELYQAIPFFMTLEPGTGRSAGVFFDCTGRVEYDVAKTRDDVVAMSGFGPVLDAFVFAGPHPKDVVQRYTELTGRMELPPLWALGYHQCRYSYYPESRVREIAREMRARGVPCDGIWLDIDYMDGYRVFTWDRHRFPDPKQLVADLAADGFRTVVIIDPGVKLDARYPVFRQGIADGHFICHPSGEPFVGTVWPGSTVFPDFLRENTRRWWGELHRELLADVGVAGIWNDMNEPSCFARNTLPDHVLQGEDGAKVPHKRVHNVYGLTMCMATMDGWRRIVPDKRPFILTRSGYAGVQRYAAVWMGDNHSWWEHLLMAVPMCLGMGLSGVPFVGTDIGGFSGDANGELLARWTQLGSLMPFCRNHSCVNTADQEPWAFGPEVESIVREYLRLRYALLPYLYTLFREAAQTGLPIMRPLLLEYPEDVNVVNLSDQFLLGRDVLVAPVYQPGATHRMVYLPAGTWVDFWTGERLEGPRFIVAQAPLERMPLYVRDGAVIPMERPGNHTGERDGRHLTLHVYAGQDGEFQLYEDAGEGYGYTAGQWTLTKIAVRRSEAGVVVAVGHPATGAGEQSEPATRFVPPRERVTVHFHLPPSHWPGTPTVFLDGAPVQPELVGPAAAAGSPSPGAAAPLVVTVPTPGARGFELAVRYESGT